MTQLVVEGNGTSVALDPRRTYRVGRDPGSEIVVAVDGVSRSHATLRFESGQWVLEDNGSANGSFEGGRRIQRVAVAPGSEIRLGHPEQGVPLTFRAGQGAPPGPGQTPAAGAPATAPGRPQSPADSPGPRPPYQQDSPWGSPPAGPSQPGVPGQYPPPTPQRPAAASGTGPYGHPPAPEVPQQPAAGGTAPYGYPPAPEGPQQSPAGTGPHGYPPAPEVPRQPATGGTAPHGYPPAAAYPGQGQPTVAPGTPVPPQQQPSPYGTAPQQAPGYGGVPTQVPSGSGSGPYPAPSGSGSGPYPAPPGPGGVPAWQSAPTHNPAQGPRPRSPIVQTMSGQYREPAHVRNLGGSNVVRIGRGPENDMVVADLRVSRQHAELRSAGGTYEIVDLGSRSGTYVNGRRVERASIGPQDIIGIGPSTFHLVDDVLMEYVDAGAVRLSAHDLTVTVDKGKVLLDHVTFPLGEKCLVAVIGPSGSGKSTLLRALTGLRPADQGVVSYDGRDLYRDYAELRSRIGLVPQDDILHTQLTVRRALIYAAELRFPDDTRQSERKARVDEVLKELGLDHRRDNKVSSLSGGQRKRVSVALELLTKPSLLFLDEPTSGLDPGLDKSVMQMLRGLADDGRTVAVVTHSVANLDICDRLLVMAPGGRIAYFGPPKEALPFLGFDDWADVFQAFDDPSIDWGGRYLQSQEHQRYVQAELVQPVAQTGPIGGGNFEQPPKAQSWPEQLSTLIRRYCRSIAADPMFLGITVLLPIIMGLLARAVPTGNLLAPPGNDSQAANLLLILCIGGCLTGAANAVRELVKERAIYQRERAVGLSRSAYLASKLLVLGLVTIAQGVVLTLVAMLGVKTHDKGVITTPLIELVLAIALLSFTAMTMGLLISALVKTSEMTMPLLVMTTLVQVVFCGALVHLDGKPGLEQVSWLVPARWALAAMAGTLNAGVLIPSRGDAPDPLWKQDTGTWAYDMGIMLVQVVVLTFLVTRMLRRQEPEVMRK
ncbi:FHA domain-containing protein [Actinoallomurus sp. NPDC050550]|uniref:FHA domain-containing protein n=1 Tax=Actinoallomurus sp. NPDC050550 TaxID=3154937 RepID=UPI0033FC2A61